MTWWVLYQNSNGAFVALTDLPADPPPTGFSLKTVGTAKPDMDAYAWDAASLGLVPRTPQRLVSKFVFVNRFTDAERRIFLGFTLDTTKTEAQRKIVDSFRWYISYLDIVNLDDTSIIAGVNYLESPAGILAAGRSAQILS